MERHPEPKHRKRIGPAIWLFLYFIDRTTKERPNQHKPDEIQGWVYGKMPLTLARMSRETGIPERTISDYLLRLEGYDYIRTIRAPHGLIILVQKSCKWLKGEKSAHSKSAKTCESPSAETCGSPAKSCESPAKTCECRKDKAVDFTDDEAIRGESTAHSACALPLSRLNSENQSQPQEKPEPLPVGETQTPSAKPYTDAVIRNGLGNLCKVPGPQRKPFTEAEIQQQQRILRERYPEQFAKAEARSAHVANA